MGKAAPTTTFLDLEGTVVKIVQSGFKKIIESRRDFLNRELNREIKTLKEFDALDGHVYLQEYLSTHR